MKRGFTLLELIVVIIIIGILATLGVTQYTKMLEKGRTAEAKMILGTIRTAQEAYKFERGSYATTITDLPVEAPTTCDSTHYFYYGATTTQATATRCTTGSNGKVPDFAGSAYNVTLSYPAATWGGTAGYY